MVVFRCCLALALLFSPHLVANPVKVTAEINEDEARPKEPLPGTILVTHEKGQTIDPESFKIEGAPIQATFLKQVQVSPGNPLVISLFSFSYPEQPPGLYMLPAVEVTVDEKVYRSLPSSYYVPDPSRVRKKQSVQSPSSQSVVLELETIVDTPTPLYPGQRFRLGYRYLYNQNIDLKGEELPLLTPKQFRTVGRVQVSDWEERGLDIREVTQQVEATKPGVYQLGPSRIEGYLYSEDFLGRKVYGRDKLVRTAQEVTITVSPFPKKGEPGSFEGAVGNYTFVVKLLSKPKVRVGELIQLELVIKGEGDLETVPMPEICCQPGFSGRFQLSDLPPLETVKGGQKHFVVDMRPLSETIDAIPSVEFSFFNPETAQYVVQKSAPIPLQVLPIPEEKKETLLQKAEEPSGKPSPPKVKPIEIVGNYPLTQSDLHHVLFGTWWVVWILPIGSVALLWQRLLQRQWAFEKAKQAEIESQHLFDEALAHQTHSAEFYRLVTQAFLMRLVEVHEIASSDLTPQQLPKSGQVGQVRAFLLELERLRFTDCSDAIKQTHAVQAEELFNQLHPEEESDA